ncbi:hypothetical protein FK873_gp166 [Micromonas pusilla virus SP1]|uniref:Uncharacterized protein n=1 Tax=Micromonas pusilla virus SP1 TaxID=373996 RepID=G9E6E5_MPSP1|nr:hypothetical protein FK873_gp166 [Micromonas pusilla virus SP1]AET84972.1 hypothetical protein MPXG_00174 [Micromonas pusilla virus SP1]
MKKIKKQNKKMEDLRDLMAELDTISKSIPEGSYLKMCDLMKGVHDGISNAARTVDRLGEMLYQERIEILNDQNPPTTDSRSLPVIPPFQVVQIPVPDENDLRHYDEIIMKIKQVEDRLKKTKIRKNITETVKRDAVKEMSRILNVPLRRFTIEELREKGGVIRDERAFYKSYIQRTNLVNRELIQEMNDELDDLYMARNDLSVMFGLA